MHTLILKKDSLDKWNTIPPISEDKIVNVNCHKFILYVIGKISWEEMTSNVQEQKDSGIDFTFGEIAKKISDKPFNYINNLESLILLANKDCKMEKCYIGQILDSQTKEMAHSFIIKRELDKYICFDKPGFKYQFNVSNLEKILNFINKDGERSNLNQEWRFIPFK